MKAYVKIQPLIVIGAAGVSVAFLAVNQSILNMVGEAFAVDDLISMSILSTISLTVACNVVIGLVSILEKWR